MAERRMSRGLLDPESEAIAEAYEAGPAVRRQLRGLLDVVQRAFSLEPQEQTAGDTALDVVGGFVPGVSQAMALRDIERARRAGDPAGMAMAATEFVPFGRLAGMMRAPGPIMSELDVYHGTPHRFPATEANPLGEFDASKIGTGEGAQAYGHGIYYAENPEAAKGYQPRDPKAEAKLMNLYKQAEARQNYDQMEVLEAAMLHRTASELREQYPDQKALINRIQKINEKSAGALYKADLPDEMIDRMLDYDKPLTQQPKNVQAALAKLGDPQEKLDAYDDALLKALFEDAADPGSVPRNPSGADILKKLENQYGRQGASDYLRGLGIPGIKYLDAGSRGQGGSGTRNFVVFPGEEKKVKILERK